MKGINLHIAKTITYRIVGSLASFAIGYGMEGWKTGLAFGVTDFFLKPALYFLHERAWHIWNREP